MIGSLLGKAGGYNIKPERERVRRPQEGSVPEMRFVAVGFRFVIASAYVHARVSVVRMRTSPTLTLTLSYPG